MKSSGVIQTSTIAARPSVVADEAGKLMFPSDGQTVQRVSSGAAYVPWGPIYPLGAEPTDPGTWVNQGSATLTTSRGALELFAPAEGSGDNIRARVKTAPATPYTVTAAIRFNMFCRAFQRAGLCWRQSSDGKLITFGLVGLGTNADPGIPNLVECAKFTSATAFSAVYGTSAAWVHGAPLFFRITDNGTNRIVSVSHDGKTFNQFHSVGRTDFLTADQYGIFVEATNNATPNFDVSMSVLSLVES